jgi:hypothetical protein
MMFHEKKKIKEQHYNAYIKDNERKRETLVIVSITKTRNDDSQKLRSLQLFLIGTFVV